MTPIYAPWNAGLGDRWATMNLLYALAMQTGRNIYVHSTGERARLNVEITASLKIPDLVRHTSNPVTHQLDGFDVWAAPSAPTMYQWNPLDSHKLVCCHFDGISSAADKNPTPAELIMLQDALWASGFTPVVLGPEHSIADAIGIMCHSAFFVGVDSGFSHIAHSVGLTTFLLEFTLPIITCHRGKAFIQCGSRHEGRFAVEDFLRHKLPTHVDMLRFIGHPDGERSTVPRDRAARDLFAQAGGRWWEPKP